MCKAPKPPKPKEPKKPEFLRNKYVDEFVGQSGVVSALRKGRSSMRIPLGSPSGIGGRAPGESLVPAAPAMNRSGEVIPVTPRPTPINDPRRPRAHLR